jgi:cell division protein FtsW
VTTANPPAGEGRVGRLGWLTSAREALRSPLAPYYLLLGASALLLTIGLIMVLSASSVYSYKTHDGDSYAVVKRQLMWVLIALPLAWLASRVPLRLIRGLTFPAYLVSLALLLATALFGIVINGNKNWLALGPLVIQPSEIAKLAMVLWAAHVYANKERRLGRLQHMLLPVVPGIFIATVLVVVGRDLGTALVFMSIGAGLLFVVGVPRRLFTIGILGLGAAVFLAATTNSERMGRILNFADPFKDFHDAGWQPAHGLYALSSGGWLGQGIGYSRQKWGDLPEAHTDFIFAVLGEELGLIGTMLVVGLFLTVAYAAVRVARETRDPFVRYASFGIVVWLIGQMMINVGMVLALLPVIGIPLPLVSYGGSALVPSLVALGLLIGFARREPTAARILSQRKRGRPAGLSAPTHR